MTFQVVRVNPDDLRVVRAGSDGFRDSKLDTNEANVGQIKLGC